jgi:hypothetical protein
LRFAVHRLGEVGAAASAQLSCVICQAQGVRVPIDRQQGREQALAISVAATAVADGAAASCF